jgi:predicted RNase H-like nuclease (RuvC/YqgF family)
MVLLVIGLVVLALAWVFKSLGLLTWGDIDIVDISNAELSERERKDFDEGVAKAVARTMAPRRQDDGPWNHNPPRDWKEMDRPSKNFMNHDDAQYDADRKLKRADEKRKSAISHYRNRMASIHHSLKEETRRKYLDHNRIHNLRAELAQVESKLRELGA